MVKSPLEIEKTRRAVQITEQALLEAHDCCRAGMTEREIAGQIALSMARQSPDCAVTRPWFIYVHASGKSAIGWDGVASDYVVQDRDLALHRLRLYLPGLHRGFDSRLFVSIIRIRRFAKAMKQQARSVRR